MQPILESRSQGRPWFPHMPMKRLRLTKPPTGACTNDGCPESAGRTWPHLSAVASTSLQG